MNQKQIDIVKATVPVLREHGEDITRHFYSDMFKAHPELLNIFNPAHQANGQQARSLAASVLAYAEHIEEAGALSGMVNRIAHKHVSLEVQPEHYPIVGHHLLGAIAAVLGEAATPEILEAWKAAYGQLADIMIAEEGQMYQAGSSQEGGWKGFKPFEVIERREESREITSFLLRPADGQRLPPFKAGQYASLRMQLPDGSGRFQIRQYSLSDCWNGETYRISVKREAGGAISEYLHEQVGAGDTLNVHMPAGDFVMNAGERPLVLLSGGVGITPMLAMLKELVQQGDTRPITFVHAARNREVHAFSDELQKLVADNSHVQRVFFYESIAPADECGVHFDEEGYLTLPKLQQYLPDQPQKADYYYCGPVGFAGAVEDILEKLGVPAEQCHTETFGPSQTFDSVIQG